MPIASAATPASEASSMVAPPGEAIHAGFSPPEAGHSSASPASVAASPATPIASPKRLRPSSRCMNGAPAGPTARAVGATKATSISAAPTQKAPAITCTARRVIKVFASIVVSFASDQGMG
jgi:hypothetical protein